MQKPMRRISTIIPVALVGILLFSGCALMSPAVSSINGSNVSDHWLNEAVAILEGDSILTPAIGVESGADLRRFVLEREIFTQILEGEVYAKGLDPSPWVEQAKPAIERELGSRYQNRGIVGPPKDAVDLIARWEGMTQAFITASTGLPDTPDTQALERIYEKLPILGLKLCFSVIGVSSPENAQKVQDRIAAKESFAQIAADLSDDLATKSRRGDAGCLTAVEVNRKLEDPALFQAAAQTRPGTTFGPFQGSTGKTWFVRSADTGNAGFDFESAIPQLVSQYEQGRRVIAQENYREAVGSADVRVVCPTGQWVATYGQVLPCGAELPDLSELPVQTAP